jgi:uncharacterized membrane protein YbaN (DUF454 family)
LTQKIVKNKFTRILLIICGSLSVAFAVLGIFLPLLPTTPLLLLAAYCFGKSSDRIYSWLINNKLFGNYIKNYQAGKGIPLHSKITAIVTMWLVLIISGVWGTDLLIIRIVLFLVGTGVTIHLLRMPTFKKEQTLLADLGEE